MKHLRIVFNIAVPATLSILMFANEAHAYIDPGTGSYVFQMIIAALVGASYAVKIYWRKIKAFFVNLSSKQGKGKENND